MPLTATTPRPAPASVERPVTRLNVEWRQLCLPSNDAVLKRWAITHPCLATVPSLNSLCVSVKSAPPEGRRDILMALLQLSAAGDKLAERCVLQLMLPVAVLQKAQLVRHGADSLEAEALAVSSLWETIATFPVNRPRQFPAEEIRRRTVRLIRRNQLALSDPGSESHRRLRREAGLDKSPRDSAASGQAPYLTWAPLDDELAQLPECPADDSDEVYAVLAWGIREEVLTLDDARLILRLHLPDVNGRRVPVGRLAEELGLTESAIWKRCSRAVQRLAARAVDDYSPAGQLLQAA